MLLATLFVGVVYVLLLVGINTPLANDDSLWLPLSLVLGTIVTFTLGSMLSSDFARVRMVELELARTVSVHGGSGQLPEPGSFLGRVLQEYASTSVELRRHTRVHAYAAGPAIWGSVLTLGAALLWGLSFVTGTVWLNYLAIVVMLPALVLLFFSVIVLFGHIGYDSAVPGFGALTPSRWRRYNVRGAAVDEAYATLPWLEEPKPTPSEIVAPARIGKSSARPWTEDASPA